MYCDRDDVKRHLGRYTSGLTATSTPSNADVDEFIGDISGEIEAVLSDIDIVTPVTKPPDFLNHLRMVNALGAAALTVAAMFPTAAGAASTDYHEWLERQYRMRLDALRKGEGIPRDVIVVGGGAPGEASVRSLWTSHPAGYVSTRDESYEPIFKRDEDQW